MILCFAGWKANPVEFDSVFNRSRHTFAYGSPDIIPIFCSALPHSTWNSYPHEYEDFATGSFSSLKVTVFGNKLTVRSTCLLLVRCSTIFFITRMN